MPESSYVITCPQCLATVRLDEQNMATNATITCPNGHIITLRGRGDGPSLQLDLDGERRRDAELLAEDASESSGQTLG